MSARSVDPGPGEEANLSSANHSTAGSPFVQNSTAQITNKSSPTSEGSRKPNTNQSWSAPGSASGEAVLGPSMNTLWNEADVEYQEPLSETSTQLEKDAWGQNGNRQDTDKSEQTSRQEDTELGIFRPDEL